MRALSTTYSGLVAFLSRMRSNHRTKILEWDNGIRGCKIEGYYCRWNETGLATATCGATTGNLCNLRWKRKSNLSYEFSYSRSPQSLSPERELQDFRHTVYSTVYSTEPQSPGEFLSNSGTFLLETSPAPNRIGCRLPGISRPARVSHIYRSGRVVT